MDQIDSILMRLSETHIIPEEDLGAEELALLRKHPDAARLEIRPSGGHGYVLSIAGRTRQDKLRARHPAETASSFCLPGQQGQRP